MSINVVLVEPEIPQNTGKHNKELVQRLEQLYT